jgi:hypothetical protein
MDNDTPDQPSQSGQQDNWKARYDGLVRKVEQVTLENRALTEQLALSASENERLKAQLSLKDVEKTSAVSERERQIAEIKNAQSQHELELAELRGMKLKLEAIKKIGKPELVKIMDTIPALQDPAAIESVFANLAAFANDAAMEREKQLKAGFTPGLSASAVAASTPGSDAEWEKYIEALPMGQERKDARNRYWDWASKKNS